MGILVLKSIEAGLCVWVVMKVVGTLLYGVKYTSVGGWDRERRQITVPLASHVHVPHVHIHVYIVNCFY